MVQLMMDCDAEVNGWSQWQGQQRTPLMVAAAQGNLTLVKLFMDVYHADDALIAPDGQMALRLAVTRGQSDVIAFLPSRRGGGWRRWKVQHAAALQKAKFAWKSICRFFKVLFWNIPKAIVKFLFWTLPKEGVMIPLKKGATWCWKHRKDFAPCCKRKVKEVPEKAKKVAQWAKKNIIDSAHQVSIFLRDELLRIIKILTRWLWTMTSVRIPAALKAIGHWIWNGVKTFGKSLAKVASSIISLLHTVYTALVSFFANLTLQDIWNGLCNILHTILVQFPAQIWSWMLKFGETSYRVLETLFGIAGEVIWWIGRMSLWVAVFVPERIWIIASSLGGSAVQGWHEIIVWVNPKR